MFAAADVIALGLAPGIEQLTFLDASQTFAVTLLLADPAGAASVSWPLPNNAILMGRTLWIDGVGGTSLPLQVTPPVGGVVH